MEVDAVTVAELKENGFRSTRRTKLVCTIGLATCAPEQLEALAMGGMNVARLNMCHGTRDWHTQVIRSIRNLNSEKGYSVAIMMDTEGSEIHLGDFNGAASVKAEVSPSHPTPRSSHTTSCLLEFQSNNSQVSEGLSCLLELATPVNPSRFSFSVFMEIHVPVPTHEAPGASQESNILFCVKGPYPHL